MCVKHMCIKDHVDDGRAECEILNLVFCYSVSQGLTIIYNIYTKILYALSINIKDSRSCGLTTSAPPALIVRF